MPLLRASVPDLEDGRAEAQRRIAMRVGAFFGLDTSDVVDISWVCDYDALTLAEIARGGPMPARSGAVPSVVEHPLFADKDPLGTSSVLPPGWWLVDRALVRGTGVNAAVPAHFAATYIADDIPEIAASTLTRFAPDRKAGAVLGGVNMLMRRPTEIVREVLSIATANGASDQALLSLWSLLLLTAYRSQPALFAAGVQARDIQRALATSWRPLAGGLTSLARSEVNTGDGERPVATDVDFALVDTTLPEGVCTPVVDAGGEMVAGVEAQRSEIVHRFLHNLLHSGFRPFTWIVESGDGARSAHALVAQLAQTNALLDAQFGVPSAEELAADAAARHLPPLVSADVLTSLGEDVATAYIWAHVDLCRLLRERTAERPEARSATTLTLRELDCLAASVLEPLHPVRLWTRNRLLMARRTDLLDRRDSAATRDAPDSASIRREIQDELAGIERELFRGVTELLRQYREGGIERGLFAGAVSSSAVDLRGIIASMPESPLTADYRVVLREAWEGFVNALGVDIDDELESVEQGEPPSAVLSGLAPDLHNYLTYRGSREAGADAVEKARIVGHLSGLMIDARRRQAKSRGAEKPLRLSYQVAQDHISKLLRDSGDALDASQRDALAARSRALTHTIVGFAAVERYLVDDAMLRARTARISLTRVIDGWLLAYEFGQPPLETPQQIWLQLNRVVDAAGLRLDEDPTGMPLTQRNILTLVARWRKLGFSEPQVLAKSESTPLTPQAEGEEGWTATARLDDDGIFERLRGTARRTFDEPLDVDVRWSAVTGVLTVDLPLLGLSDDVSFVTATVHSADGVPFALTLRASGAHHGVRLTGQRSEVALPKPDGSQLSIVAYG